MREIDDDLADFIWSRVSTDVSWMDCVTAADAALDWMKEKGYQLPPPPVQGGHQ